MSRLTRTLATAAVSALLVTLSPVPASAAVCASRAEVREQIAELRQAMRDDVKSARARSATAEAVHEVIEAFRGTEADSGEERRILGREIAARLKEMRDTRNTVEKKALRLDVKALRVQRERGKMTAEDRATLRADFTGLKQAVLAKASPGAERRELAAHFRELRATIAC